jgi:hypothetical protein
MYIMKPTFLSILFNNYAFLYIYKFVLEHTFQKYLVSDYRLQTFAKGIFIKGGSG